MRYKLLMKAEIDELLILDKPINYMKLYLILILRNRLRPLNLKWILCTTTRVRTLVDSLEGKKPIGCK